MLDMKRRDFSSLWLLCIVWLAVFAPGAGAEQNYPVTFQIQVSQPEYERAGGVWTCGAAQLFRDQCRGTCRSSCSENPCGRQSRSLLCRTT